MERAEVEKQVVLGIKEAAAVTPFSESSLYRIAPDPDSPFWKQCGRWATTPEKLKEWVERGAKPRRASIGNPMPLATTKRRGSFAAKLAELERSTGGIDS